MPAVGTIGEGLFELGIDEGEPEAPLRRGYGGDAANTAVMAALAGAESRLGGRVGDDALGRLLLAFWEGTGVDTRWVVVDPDAPTGFYVNERPRAGGSRFHYHRRGSAGSGLSGADLPDDFLHGLGVLFFTGVTLSVSARSAEATREAARRARRRGIAVAFAVNHRPALGGDVAELAQAAHDADVVFATDEEVREVLAGDLGRADEIVVTLGAGGARVDAGGAVTRIPAPAVDVVDTSGAGDALAGAYLAGRLQGLAPAAALERAVIAASLSCRAYGCALSYPDRESVDSMASAARYP
jgi:2-dehydro-3-deoxygluconokinase